MVPWAAISPMEAMPAKEMPTRASRSRRVNRKPSLFQPPGATEQITRAERSLARSGRQAPGDIIRMVANIFSLMRRGAGRGSPIRVSPPCAWPTSLHTSPGKDPRRRVRPPGRARSVPRLCLVVWPNGMPDGRGEAASTGSALVRCRRRSPESNQLHAPRKASRERPNQKWIRLAPCLVD